MFGQAFPVYLNCNCWTQSGQVQRRWVSATIAEQSTSTPLTTVVQFKELSITQFPVGDSDGEPYEHPNGKPLKSDGDSLCKRNGEPLGGSDGLPLDETDEDVPVKLDG